MIRGRCLFPVTGRQESCLQFVLVFDLTWYQGIGDFDEVSVKLPGKTAGLLAGTVTAPVLGRITVID